jgi:hypothetical protein
MDIVQRPELVASDVDGTLLDASEGVSDRTRTVLANVLAAGVPVALATGRPPRWVPRIAAAAGLTGFAVCSNGSTIYDMGADKIVGTELLRPELLAKVSEALRAAIPGIAFAVERVGAKAVDPEVPPFLTEPGYQHPWGDDPHTVVLPVAEVLGEPCVKMLARSVDLTSEQMAVAARGPLAGIVDVTYSTSDGLLELSPIGVTKASGLAQVTGWLGLDPSGVIAFGDMPNDLPMLRWAGHGVAMANAHPDLLAAADEVTAPHTEDGLAQVLERWF